ncbi:MAG: NAD-glutamate dehydrogenase, partial [Mesorhizobium sp.]
MTMTDSREAIEYIEVDRSVVMGFLFEHAADEDLSKYGREELVRAAASVERHLAMYHPGTSVVSIDRNSGLTRQGRPVSVITVINDNMPFLFDSVLGEVTDAAGEPFLVAHPVINANSGRWHVGGHNDGGSRVRGKDDGRVSIVHIHVRLLSDNQVVALEDRIKRVLTQVRAAVTDWRSMLARLDQAISEFRYAPVPLDKASVTEAIAFLEWLRDDNFTFLGMREFKYTGSEKSGTLERADKPGLGILSDPDVLVLRRGTEAVSTT